MNTPSSNPPNDDESFLPANWTELQPLLDELLDASAEQRATRLAELSNGNAALRRQLEQLLAEAELAMPLLDEPAARRFDDLFGLRTSWRNQAIQRPLVKNFAG